MSLDSPEEEKVLSFQSDYPGQFKIIDSAGRKVAEGFERPGTACYISARIHGPEKGQIIDAFGGDANTLEEGKKKVVSFFEKNGFSIQE